MFSLCIILFPPPFGHAHPPQPVRRAPDASRRTSQTPPAPRTLSTVPPATTPSHRQSVVPAPARAPAPAAAVPAAAAPAPAEKVEEGSVSFKEALRRARQWSKPEEQPQRLSPAHCCSPFFAIMRCVHSEQLKSSMFPVRIFPVCARTGLRTAAPPRRRHRRRRHQLPSADVRKVLCQPSQV